LPESKISSLMERKFENGETVLAGDLKLKMLVVSAYEALAGWKYKCAFTKKDGTPDKRRESRFYWEKELNKI
jgi:hypothetical protein